MLSINTAVDEARLKLCDKLWDIRNKTHCLHQVIDDISRISIAHAEGILKEVHKQDFFSQYIKVSQELEGSLGKLLIILDTAGSLGVLNANKEDTVINSADLTKNIKNNNYEMEDTSGKSIRKFMHLPEEGNNNIPKIEPPIQKMRKEKSHKKVACEKVSCNLCGKTMGHRELKLHMACRHTSESRSELKYVCMLCPTNPKRYARSDRLKEHIEGTHLNIINKHICTLCGRGFNRPGKRNKHQIHCKVIDPTVDIMIMNENNVVLERNVGNIDHSVVGDENHDISVDIIDGNENSISANDNNNSVEYEICHKRIDPKGDVVVVNDNNLMMTANDENIDNSDDQNHEISVDSIGDNENSICGNDNIVSVESRRHQNYCKGMDSNINVEVVVVNGNHVVLGRNVENMGHSVVDDNHEVSVDSIESN